MLNQITQYLIEEGYAIDKKGEHTQNINEVYDFKNAIDFKNLPNFKPMKNFVSLSEGMKGMIHDEELSADFEEMMREKKEQDLLFQKRILKSQEKSSILTATIKLLDNFDIKRVIEFLNPKNPKEIQYSPSMGV
jgi:hypothetical protein